MAKQRHLQQEVEKKLKQVEEGCETFNITLKKIHSTVNQTQKERLEGELKKEIKKLQRLREHLRNFQTNPDIRDKNLIQEARKKIEDLMATFKSCERENKLKAFSKEGLAIGTRTDPYEEEKDTARDWIRSAQQQLQDAVNSHEVEIEKISKAKKPDPARVNELNRQVVRFKFHYDQLDLVLRSLENEVISVENIWELKDTFDLFIEKTDDQFLEGDLERIYEELEIGIKHSDAYSEEENKKNPKKPEPPKVISPAPKSTSPPPLGKSQPPRSAWDSKDALVKIAGEKFAQEIKAEESEEHETVRPTKETWEYEDLEVARQRIEAGFQEKTRSEDRIKSRLQIVKSRYQSHSSFPTKPLTVKPAHISKLELDTLFFIFYHQPGTYQQLLAAKELKRKDWMYNKRFQTWFQRQSEPVLKTAEKEKGTYMYFDYEKNWSQRGKADFEFEYSYLENEL
mmetsp:Transcript_6342/g.9411  ORF Transcript_6342/g.9411 Transcript_6342/m.9411 type:complete len:455 (+) Transcript_6342:3-1367(+)